MAIAVDPSIDGHTSGIYHLATKLISILFEQSAGFNSIEKITFPGFVDYVTYMEGIGLSRLWDELEVISENL
ncbi:MULTISPECIES: hypothetical protein [Pseudomonas]|uniref:hypothetical protein n=1 Tax=Pseudomonas TaxID=286 RepID=UPI0000387735|nr:MULTISPECIES: hypothetical protein [Pseudomonas]MBL0797535.1 hypothetical protein [Pseudomonas sp. B7]MBX8621050.1 hypothetical protein [Pseudomonas glycinae]MBY9024826.1 hypothetical protein [Pseudomonas fluorescens]MBY9030660.1 hypothetical protein [Pseudomonas fluorescens]MBY9036663.1 hypothetical protein [Pseudomonas fluorescens]